jgi:hypothetical protein
MGVVVWCHRAIGNGILFLRLHEQTRGVSSLGLRHALRVHPAAFPQRTFRTITASNARWRHMLGKLMRVVPIHGKGLLPI